MWFDDIPLEYVDGDLVPKQVESGTRSVSLVTGNDKRLSIIASVA